jgi:hypothetical protein
MNIFSSSNPILDDDPYISEALIGRLHHATEDSVLDLVATLRASERACLAMHCYRKSHLRRIGLAIASSCDLNTLVQEWGSTLGGAIFAKSRERTEERGRSWARQRPAVTLARSAGGTYAPPIDFDDLPGNQQTLPA